MAEGTGAVLRVRGAALLSLSAGHGTRPDGALPVVGIIGRWPRRVEVADERHPQGHQGARGRAAGDPLSFGYVVCVLRPGKPSEADPPLDSASAAAARI